MQAEIDSIDVFRVRGNNLFKEQKFSEAEDSYREGLALLKVAETKRGCQNVASSSEEHRKLAVNLRLNLSCVLVKNDQGLEDAVHFCDEALQIDATNAKVLFRRGSAWQGLARKLTDDPQAQQKALLAAKKDFQQAGKIEPTDKQIRTSLNEVTEALRASGHSSSGGGLRGGFAGGLYDDRKASEPPAPPVICVTCGREGHEKCGKACWLEQRARWLDLQVSEVDYEPPSFEDDGPLVDNIRNARRIAGLAMHELHDVDEDLSESEREMLEDCLESTERPYPQPKKSLPLPLAVQCAEELWAD